MTDIEVSKWLDRVIPLPKEITIHDSLTVAAQQIGIEVNVDDLPPIQTAVGLLGSFALGRGDQASFKIRLSLMDGQNGIAPEIVRKRLTETPNCEQAYAILPLEDQKGLLLIAHTCVGLLYAARTLSQLVRPPDSTMASTQIELPLVSVTDWPDLPERGQWGGNVEGDMAWTSKWKLNVIEASAHPWVDPDGDIQIRMNRDLFRQGSELGVKIVPFILHLEQIAAYSGLERRSDLTSTPDPSKPLPSDYIPGLCFSSPATKELISIWLDKIADMEEVSDFCVWLSEGEAKCFCEKCLGKEPYGLEVACITDAFKSIQPEHPDVRLRLLLSQGSYPVNDRILAVKPGDVGITYYDGGKTYDSSRNPIIYPLLEKYAALGGWLGCYPQITHSWRTVFPWTAPQFIQFRAQEFARKKLACMIGYAVPSNRHHEFNVAAMAEWTWNSEGRSVEEFARAYSTVTGVCDPDLFARWAIRAGEAGWALAETNMLCCLIYDPAIGIKGEGPADHRFEKAGIVHIDQFQEALSLAHEALDLANRSGNADRVCESECTLAGLEAFSILRHVFRILRGAARSDEDKKTLAGRLDDLDRCTQIMRARLLEWGERIRIHAGEDRLPTRLLDTACVLFRTCDVFREMAGSIGVEDPRPEFRLARVGQWSGENFADTTQPVLRFDMTNRVPVEGGSYQLGIDYVDSAYGTNLLRACVIGADDQGEQVLTESPDCPDGVSIWERWAELRMEIPRRAEGTKLWLEIELSGLPADAPEGRRTCAGTIGLRRAC